MTDERQKALDHLDMLLSKGDTIYYIVKNVSNAGTYRHIDFYTFKVLDEFEEGQNRVVKMWLTRSMCTALGYKFKEKTNCMGVSGGGMDMGFHVIHQLGHKLYDDGYALHYEQL